MPLTGTNKLCRHCLKKCKQYDQIRIIRCPNYEYNGKSSNRGSQQAQQNA